MGLSVSALKEFWIQMLSRVKNRGMVPIPSLVALHEGMQSRLQTLKGDGGDDLFEKWARKMEVSATVAYLEKIKGVRAMLSADPLQEKYTEIIANLRSDNEERVIAGWRALVLEGTLPEVGGALGVLYARDTDTVAKATQAVESVWPKITTAERNWFQQPPPAQHIYTTREIIAERVRGQECEKAYILMLGLRTLNLTGHSPAHESGVR